VTRISGRFCGDLAIALTDGEFRDISGAELFQELKSFHAVYVTQDMPKSDNICKTGSYQSVGIHNNDLNWKVLNKRAVIAYQYSSFL
jgi:hypothetical protein